MPSPVGLGGEEGLEDARLRLGVHADAGVRDREHARSGPARRRSGAHVAPSSRSTLAVSMVSVPPSGMASRALTARFMRTCSIWPGSALTGPAPAPSAVTSSTSSPIAGAASSPCPRTTAFRSSTSGCEDLLAAEGQELARQGGGPVRRAVGSPPRRARVSGPPGCSRAAARCSRVMTVRRLLKSWAMPPASRPTASIFCDWRSCSSSARALGHVADEADDDRSLVRLDRAQADIGRELAAIFVARDLLESGLFLGAEPGREQDVDRVAEKLIPLVTEHALGFGVQERDLTVARQHDHSVGRGFHQ